MCLIPAVRGDLPRSVSEKINSSGIGRWPSFVAPPKSPPLHCSRYPRTALRDYRLTTRPLPGEPPAAAPSLEPTTPVPAAHDLIWADGSGFDPAVLDLKNARAVSSDDFQPFDSTVDAVHGDAPAKWEAR